MDKRKFKRTPVYISTNTSARIYSYIAVDIIRRYTGTEEESK